MSVQPASKLQTAQAELADQKQRLDRACRTHWGISAAMFRTAKFIFYIAALAFSGYLIEFAGVDPFWGMAFAALLITGPEGLETWLLNRGAIPEQHERPTTDERKLES